MKGVRIPQVRDQKIISEDVVHQGKFIRTKMITYNRGAEIKKWEGIERCTRTSDTDVAAILTIVKKKNEPDSLVLVRQFRPATGKYSVEFPAGLIDKGETAEQAALRELKEETGYQVRCRLNNSDFNFLKGKSHLFKPNDLCRPWNIFCKYELGTR
eukprot:TRINITY_DN1783_c0_g1_i2.p1 TRINITY_DN1783_c0_g1~~TRINITY_DN1783_c0_g1_i2.p1  ORF type:complete len:181 (+),score=37.12 TRINITY_DN1783_c0_g1_i2:77-544(+)